MVIDIINYTEEQFASLSTDKLERIRAAQLKKNKLRQTLDKDILKSKQELIDRGIFTSTIFEKKQAELAATFEAEVAILREALLFYLHYAGSLDEASKVPEGVPYEVDYALTEEERMISVREYYLSTYSNATSRLTAFNDDSFARSYLGELYATLWHYFEDLARLG